MDSQPLLEDSVAEELISKDEVVVPKKASLPSPTVAAATQSVEAPDSDDEETPAPAPVVPEPEPVAAATESTVVKKKVVKKKV
jgi:hypothetical protein